MSPADATGYKYGALVFSPPPGPKEPTRMFAGKETFEGNLLALVPEGEQGHWSKWVGTVAWGAIKRATRIVLARVPSERPLVVDDENERLLSQVRSAWAAYLLSGGCEYGGEAWVLSGQAGGATHGTPLLSIRSFQPMDSAVSPFYASRDRHTKMRAAAMMEAWTGHGALHDDSWFRSWLEADELLGQRPTRPPILALSVLAYSSAWTRRHMEFSIPEFVRAAEGVLALPSGTGRGLFSRRALRLVPRLCSDEYVAADIETLLVELYKLRIDCVHGMIPFEKLQALGEEGADRAGQLNYVAEVVARESLLVALRRSDWSVFETREALEAAWASGAFP